MNRNGPLGGEQHGRDTDHTAGGNNGKQHDGDDVDFGVLAAMRGEHRPPEEPAPVIEDLTEGDRSAPPAESGVKPSISNGVASKNGFAPASMPDILARIDSVTDGWPRRIGSSLFVHERPDGVDWLDSPAALFGYVGTKAGKPARFYKDPGRIRGRKSSRKPAARRPRTQPSRFCRTSRKSRGIFTRARFQCPATATSCGS